MDQSRSLKLERVYAIWGLVLLLWSIYRVYADLPEWFDEFVAKPLVFLAPMLTYVAYKEKRSFSSIGLSVKNFSRDLYIGLGFGALFAVEGIIANAFKYGKFSFLPLIPTVGTSLMVAAILAFATSFNEELLTRGFLFTRLKEEYKSDLKAMLVSSAMYLLLLIPLIFTTTKISGATLLIFLMTNVIMSFANTMIFNTTKTITIPVLIHAFWNMALVLYL